MIMTGFILFLLGMTICVFFDKVVIIRTGGWILIAGGLTLIAGILSH